MSDSESCETTVKIYNWKFQPDYSSLNESPIFSMFVHNIELKWKLEFRFAANSFFWHTTQFASQTRCILSYHSEVEVHAIISTSIESVFEMKTFEKRFLPESYFKTSETFIKFGDVIESVIPTILNFMCKIEIDEAQFKTASKFVQIVRDFEILVDDEKTSDVILRMEMENGKKLHAHKALLSSQSPVFASMFDHDMAEKRSNIVKIKDISYEVMKRILLFIYSGKVNLSEELFLESLYVAADKYCIDDLRRQCSCTMIETVTVGNALKYLELAHKYKDEPFKSKIMKFVSKRAKEITDLPELQQLQDADLIREMFVASIKIN